MSLLSGELQSALAAGPAEPARLTAATEARPLQTGPSSHKAQGSKLRWRRPNRVAEALPTTPAVADEKVEQVSFESRSERQARLQLGDPTPALLVQDSSQAAPPAQLPESELPPDLFRQPSMPIDDGDLVFNKPQPTPCPTPKDLKPITEITTNIAATGTVFPEECGLGDEVFTGRHWAPKTYTWKASGICHKPLYFEDVQLERYGHSAHPLVQPFLSGAHFFATVPILPYKMGMDPPNECVYPLGWYRPGSCAPRMIYPVPLSLRGALVQGATVTGLIFVMP